MTALQTMPLRLPSVRESSEDLFRALFGARRGIPKKLMLTHRLTFTEEVDETLKHFASRHLGFSEPEGGDWLALGGWRIVPPDPTEHWQGFLSYRGEVIAVRLDDEILFSKEISDTGQLPHFLDICEELGVKVLFAARSKLLAVESAVRAKGMAAI